MTFHLFMATPEKILFDGEILSITLPGSEGDFQVLKNHAPLMATLKTGKLSITDAQQKKQTMHIAGGWFEVVHNQATLLATSIDNSR